MQRRISDHSPFFKRSKQSWPRSNRFETNQKSTKYHQPRNRDRNQMPVFERRGDNLTWHSRNVSRRRQDNESNFYEPQWRANRNSNYRPPSHNRNYRRYRNYLRETRQDNRHERETRPWSPELNRRQQVRKRASRRQNDFPSRKRPRVTLEFLDKQLDDYKAKCARERMAMGLPQESTKLNYDQPAQKRRYNRQERETRPWPPEFNRSQQFRKRASRQRNDFPIRKRPRVTLEFLDKQLDDYMAKCARERMAMGPAQEATNSNDGESEKNEKP
ncbi:hypothetical protein ACOME3_002261 [Neoechinorhynchus agilis]